MREESKIEPIISPWIFYAIDVAHKMQIVAICACTISMLALFTIPLPFSENGQKRKKFCIICVIICVLMFIFVPSKETMIQFITTYKTEEVNK